MDLTQLVVSELVTNARKYAPGPVLMDLRIVSDAVEVVVWDCDPVLPVARAADAGRVGQHGLEIVMAVAQGFEAQREPVGKRITARIALLDDPSGAFAGRRLLWATQAAPSQPGSEAAWRASAARSSPRRTSGSAAHWPCLRTCSATWVSLMLVCWKTSRAP
jgi:hypothetical protein